METTLFLVLVPVIVILLLILRSKGGEDVISLDAEAFQAKMEEEEGVLLDVRSSKEFQAGHLKGARNINFLQKGFGSKVKDIDKKTPLYVYCRSGTRSKNAVVNLQKMGFSNVTNLSGGILGWQGEIVK